MICQWTVGAVESQVEVLKSESIALAVIKQLHLTEDPEFTGGGGGLIGTLLGMLTSSLRIQRSEFGICADAPCCERVRKPIEYPARRFDLRHFD